MAFCPNCAALADENARLRQKLDELQIASAEFFQRLHQTVFPIHAPDLADLYRVNSTSTTSGSGSRPETPAYRPEAELPTQRAVWDVDPVDVPQLAPHAPCNPSHLKDSGMKSSGLMGVPVAKSSRLAKRPLRPVSPTCCETPPLTKRPSVSAEPTGYKPREEVQFASPDPVTAKITSSQEESPVLVKDLPPPTRRLHLSASIGVTQHITACLPEMDGEEEADVPLKRSESRGLAEKIQLERAARKLPVSSRPLLAKPQHPSMKAFKFKETVRGKDDRLALKGYDCVDCQRFYDAIKDQPNAADIKIDCSRHRSRFTPPNSPKGYWDLTMPETLSSQ